MTGLFTSLGLPGPHKLVQAGSAWAEDSGWDRSRAEGPLPQESPGALSDTGARRSLCVPQGWCWGKGCPVPTTGPPVSAHSPDPPCLAEGSRGDRPQLVPVFPAGACRGAQSTGPSGWARCPIPRGGPETCTPRPQQGCCSPGPPGVREGQRAHGVAPAECRARSWGHNRERDTRGPRRAGAGSPMGTGGQGALAFVPVCAVARALRVTGVGRGGQCFTGRGLADRAAALGGGPGVQGRDGCTGGLLGRMRGGGG